MGISTIQSYCGAQIFEAVGLERVLVDRHFTGTASRIGGIGADVLAQEALGRHDRAWGEPVAGPDPLLPVGGVYAWRREGEHHMWNPETIALVQHAVRVAGGPSDAPVNGAGPAATWGDAWTKYEEYSRLVNDDAGAPRHPARPAALPHRPRAGADRRGRARPRRSCGASPPVRCRSARSRPSPTRRSRSR